MYKRLINVAIVNGNNQSKKIIVNGIKNFNCYKFIDNKISGKEISKSIIVNFLDVIFFFKDSSDKNYHECIKELYETNPHLKIIFISNTAEDAIQVIKYSVFDFILLPLSMDDILKVLYRILEFEKMTNRQNCLDMIRTARLSERKISFRIKHGNIYKFMHDILYVESTDNYCKLHCTNSESKILYENIVRIETRLNKLPFTRINRSVIINNQYVTEVCRKSQKCFLKTNENEYVFSISKNCIKLLEANL